MTPAMPEQPDLTPREVSGLTGGTVSYWTVLKEIERGNLKAYKRPGGRLAIRHDDYCTWAYGEPVVPKERIEVLEQAPRPSRRRPTRGSVTALREIERGAA
jgi:hypothetical protein